MKNRLSPYESKNYKTVVVHAKNFTKAKRGYLVLSMKRRNPKYFTSLIKANVYAKRL